MCPTGRYQSCDTHHGAIQDGFQDWSHNALFALLYPQSNFFLSELTSH